MDSARARTKILVVDDDPLHRGLVRAIFEEDPYEVIEAADAAEGLETALSRLPQLIVVDMRMTRMSGLEFLQTARAHPGIKHIPIVVSTALSSSPQGLECLRSGAAAYFEKPLDPEPFRRRVKQLLGHPLDPN